CARQSFPTRRSSDLSRVEEREVLLRMSGGEPIPVDRVLDPSEILASRREIAGIHLDQRLVDFIVDLVRATREPGAVGLAQLAPLDRKSTRLNSSHDQ